MLWAGAICLRLVYLQIFRYGDFEQRAQRQQQRTTEVAAKRGIIYDRAGRELAMSVSVDSVFAVPADIPDLAGTISLVARITKADPRELLAKCQAARTFCWVARKADAETADRIRAMNLRGIYFQKESKRFYPKRELAAQVLGYVGMDDEGLSGIERADDDDLRGKPGRMLISVDARRKWFGSVEKQPDPGENVVLTIDEKIQYIAERELETAMQQTHAESGTVVVQNPKTGEILALANRPTFNPNLARDITPQKLKDHAVSDVYEPGSTFKVVTIAAALEEKLTRPDEVFDCQMGSIVINGMRIRDSKPHGLLTVAGRPGRIERRGSHQDRAAPGRRKVLQIHSRLWFRTADRHRAAGRDPGFDQAAESLVKSFDRGDFHGPGDRRHPAAAGRPWFPPSRTTASGLRRESLPEPPQPQGAPQMVAFHPGVQRRVISPMTAAQMKQMMQGVVLHGTGKKAILEGYSSAGKTGTAQKVDPATHAYSHTKYVGSFAGFAPVNDPAITVAVILDSAVGLHQGGQVSAPVFQRVAQQVLEYLHTPHDVELPPNRQVLMAERRVKDQDVEEGSPDRLGDSLEAVDSTPADSNPQPASRFREAHARRWPPAWWCLRRCASAEPAAPAGSRAKANCDVGRQTAGALPLPAHLPSSGTIVLDVEQGGIVVPSFLGKSVRTAIEMAQESGLDLDAVGSGLARQQSPPPGSHVASGSQVTVKFGR